jgi:hypothetical protein
MKKTTWTLLVLSAVAWGLIGCNGDDQTTVEGENMTALTFHKPADVTITRGQTAEITLKIERKNLDDEIEVAFSDLPAGVTIVNADKNIVGNEGVYRLQAAQDAALVSNDQASVKVTATEQNIGVTKEFMITVKEAQ